MTLAREASNAPPRHLPHAPELERSVLGALIGHDAVRAWTLVGPDADVCFVDAGLSAAYRAVTRLHARGLVPDDATVADELKRNEPGAPITPGELAALVGDACPVRLLPGYLDSLRRHSVTRRMRLLSVELGRALTDGNDAAAGDVIDALVETRGGAGVEALDPSLYPVDLADVLAGTAVQPMPEHLLRDDGAALLYPGAVNGIHGDSGTGKGWIVCHLVQQNALRGVRTMLLDFEDTAHSITARLRLLGMSDQDIETWLVYLRPQVPFGGVTVAHVVNTIRELNVGGVVIDSLGEAFGLAGVNEDKDVEVGPWLRMVARAIADTGVSLTLIDHSTKAGTNDLHPSGSKRKRAAITGASYLVEAVKPFVKEQGGRLRLTCAKDRHGNYRRGQVVGDLVMDSSELGVRLKLYAPSAPALGDATVPTILAARSAVAAVKEAGQPVSQKALVGLMKIKASTDTKRGGIEYAATFGALTEEAGPHNARLFRYSRDLEEET